MRYKINMIVDGHVLVKFEFNDLNSIKAILLLNDSDAKKLVAGTNINYEYSPYRTPVLELIK